MTLADFLLARLAEDGAAAQSAVAGWDAATDGRWGALADHADRHGPARVLREVAAKRRIVSEYAEAVRLDDGNDNSDHGFMGARSALEFAVRALAAVYADHDDYDESWAADA